MAKKQTNKKIRLLKKVREAVTASDYNLLGMKMYSITCEKGDSLPRQVLISCTIDELKSTVRTMRLALARELFPRKNKKISMKDTNKLDI